MKPFLEWTGLKEKLDGKEHKPPMVSEGDIWWASLGTNIGSEIDGKSSLFTRPVIIYKKLAHGFYFIIPATSKPQEGSWYVSFNYQENTSVACLHQARAIDHRRLSNKIGTIDEADFKLVKQGFGKLYGI